MRNLGVGVAWAVLAFACSEHSDVGVSGPRTEAAGTSSARASGTNGEVSAITPSGASVANSAASVIPAASTASAASACPPQQVAIPANYDTTYEVPVVFTSHGSPFELGALAVAQNGQGYTVGQLKLFLSEFALERKDGTLVPVVPVDASESALPFSTVLLDAEADKPMLRLRAPAAEYSAFRARVGLPAACNSLDPTRNVFPLNADSGMYWTWGNRYIFVLVEGSVVDTATGGKAQLSLHTGSLLAEDPSTDCSIRVPFSAGLTGAKLQIDVDELATPPSLNQGTSHGPAPWLYDRMRSGSVFSFVP